MNFLNTQEEKDRLQQNVALIKMEERTILKEILKLEHWIKLELILIFLILAGAGVLLSFQFLYN